MTKMWNGPEKNIFYVNKTVYSKGCRVKSTVILL